MTAAGRGRERRTAMLAGAIKVLVLFAILAATMWVARESATQLAERREFKENTRIVSGCESLAGRMGYPKEFTARCIGQQRGLHENREPSLATHEWQQALLYLEEKEALRRRFMSQAEAPARGEAWIEERCAGAGHPVTWVASQKSQGASRSRVEELLARADASASRGAAVFPSYLLNQRLFASAIRWLYDQSLGEAEAQDRARAQCRAFWRAL